MADYEEEIDYYGTAVIHGNIGDMEEYFQTEQEEEDQEAESWQIDRRKLERGYFIWIQSFWLLELWCCVYSY